MLSRRLLNTLLLLTLTPIPISGQNLTINSNNLKDLQPYQPDHDFTPADFTLTPRGDLFLVGSKQFSSLHTPMLSKRTFNGKPVFTIQPLLNTELTDNHNVFGTSITSVDDETLFMSFDVWTTSRSSRVFVTALSQESGSKIWTSTAIPIFSGDVCNTITKLVAKGDMVYGVGQIGCRLDKNGVPTPRSIGVFAISTNDNGNILWSQKWSIEKGESGDDLDAFSVTATIDTTDSGLIASVTSLSANLYVMKWTSNGEIMWTKKQPSPVEAVLRKDGGWSSVASDSESVYIGYKQTGKLVLSKLSRTNGDEVWTIRDTSFADPVKGFVHVSNDKLYTIVSTTSGNADNANQIQKSNGLHDSDVYVKTYGLVSGASNSADVASFGTNRNDILVGFSDHLTSSLFYALAASSETDTLLLQINTCGLMTWQNVTTNPCAPKIDELSVRPNRIALPLNPEQPKQPSEPQEIIQTGPNVTGIIVGVVVGAIVCLAIAGYIVKKYRKQGADGAHHGGFRRKAMLQVNNDDMESLPDGNHQTTTQPKLREFYAPFSKLFRAHDNESLPILSLIWAKLTLQKTNKSLNSSQFKKIVPNSDTNDMNMPSLIGGLQVLPDIRGKRFKSTGREYTLKDGIFRTLKQKMVSAPEFSLREIATESSGKFSPSPKEKLLRDGSFTRTSLDPLLPPLPPLPKPLPQLSSITLPARTLPPLQRDDSFDAHFTKRIPHPPTIPRPPGSSNNLRLTPIARQHPLSAPPILNPLSPRGIPPATRIGAQTVIPNGLKCVINIDFFYDSLHPVRESFSASIYNVTNMMESYTKRVQDQLLKKGGNSDKNQLVLPKKFVVKVFEKVAVSQELLVKSSISKWVQLSKNVNVESILGFVEGPPMAIILPYYEHSLATILSSSSKSPQIDPYQLARDIISGIHWIHMMGMYHVNLKAENVLFEVSEDGTAIQRGVLSDFSVVGMPSRQSLAYQSPEMLSGMAIESTERCQKADIYAMAILFYEVMEMKRAWRGVSDEEIKTKVLKGGRPDISSETQVKYGGSSENPGLVGVMKACWEQNVDHRLDVFGVEELMLDVA